jgi:hypothetical protein
VGKDFYIFFTSSLRELGDHAETIERNLELLDSEVRKNESSQKNNETSINNKLELITSKQGQHSHLLQGMQDKVKRDGDKIEENKANFEGEIIKLNEKHLTLSTELEDKFLKSNNLIESVKNSTEKEISSQVEVVRESCESENQQLR